jgi:TolB-like protein
MKSGRSIFWALTLTLLLSLSGAGQEKAGVRPSKVQEAAALVVLTFDGPPSQKDFRGELLADLLTTHLGKQVPIVERQALAKILAEQELNRTGLVNADEAIRIGKLVGAKYLIAGRVFRLGDSDHVTMRVVSVETARFKGVTLKMPGDSAVDEIAAGAAQELLKELPRLRAELSKPLPSGSSNSITPAFLNQPTVAVLNFDNQNQGDTKWSWLSKGLADLTIGDLASQDLRVVNREQMQEMIHELHLKKENADPQTVARVLKVVRFVHGTYRETAGQVELTANIVDAVSGNQQHTARAAGPTTEVLNLQKKLSAELADVLKGNQPGTLDPALLPRWTESLSASQLLYQGIDLFDQGQYLEAWGQFRRALKGNPDYADARYWAGRMMYYVQEYQQARVDLESFAAAHPNHGRVGDAVMEIISAAQLTAIHSDEVLQALYFAAQLAPKAEVHNQFGATFSSTVGLYAAGIAAQILRPQERYREAFAFYLRHLEGLQRDSMIYWMAWRELSQLRTEHIKATGEALEMPPLPRLTWVRQQLEQTGRRKEIMDEEIRDLERKGTHQHYPTIVYGKYAALTVDDPVWQELCPVTPAQPTVELDFSHDPLVPVRWYQQSMNYPPRLPYYWGQTYIRHYYADPQHELTGIDLEIRYRHDPGKSFTVRLEGDVTTPYFPLDSSGLIKHTIPMPFGTRALSCRLSFSPLRASTETTTAALLSWKMTAHFRPVPAATGTLVLRTADDLSFRIKLDGQDMPEVKGVQKLQRVPAGKHTLRFRPVVWGPNPEQETSFELAPGETLGVTLSAQVDQRRRGNAPRPWRTRTNSADYPIYRFGLGLGDRSGARPEDVFVCRDRYGRWIVVWGMRRDLYMSISTDRGQTWSAPQALPTPVNSAHSERYPVLMQDAEGRYVLAFSSDRGSNHAHAVYVCWSEDLINFSAPVLALGDSSIPYRLLRRADGMFLAYSLSPPKYTYGATEDGKRVDYDPFACTVCASLDLQHWTPPRTMWTGNSFYVALEILEDRGRFLALSFRQIERHQELEMQTSLDGITVSSPQRIPYQGVQPYHLFGGQDRLGLYLVTAAIAGQSTVLRYDGGTAWTRVGAASPVVGIALDQKDVPRWGRLALDENNLHFFGLPYRDDSYQAKPLWCCEYALAEKSLATEDPVAQDPPKAVNARFEKGPFPQETAALPMPRLAPPGQSRLSPLPAVSTLPALPPSEPPRMTIQQAPAPPVRPRSVPAGVQPTSEKQ